MGPKHLLIVKKHITCGHESIMTISLMCRHLTFVWNVDYSEIIKHIMIKISKNMNEAKKAKQPKYHILLSYVLILYGCCLFRKTSISGLYLRKISAQMTRYFENIGNNKLQKLTN